MSAVVTELAEELAPVIAKAIEDWHLGFYSQAGYPREAVDELDTHVAVAVAKYLAGDVA